VKIVMTLLVRDERDTVEEHLDFHLAAGVDEVIVTDHASTDGTEDVLARYERDGRVRVLREPDGPFRQREWVTHMARLAATEHGADWVVNGDADEFWWPRGGSLQEVLAAVPRRYGIVQSLVRHFVPVADDGRPFHERMTYRLRPTAPVNDPASPWRPYRKVVHRASPDVVLVEGGHAVRSDDLQPLRGWYPIECLHFPLRSPAQVERKGRAWGAAVEKFYATSEVPRSAGTAYHALQHDAAVRGEADAYYGALALGPDDVADGIAAGLLEEDLRVRDALRDLSGAGRDAPLAFPRPTTLETASFAIDAAVLGEADVIRTQRWLDDLERRVGRLERTTPVRIERRLRDLARKALRR
jgi:glycosyl transferase family 2